MWRENLTDYFFDTMTPLIRGVKNIDEKDGNEGSRQEGE